MTDKELREELREIIINYGNRSGGCANDFVDTILSKYHVLPKDKCEVVDLEGARGCDNCPIDRDCDVCHEGCKIKSIIVVKG